MSQNVGLAAQDLITMAAEEIGVLGVGQSLTGQDVQACFVRLNLLLDEWSENRPSVFHLVDINFPCDNSQSYTVGVGGKVNTTFVPPRVESAYFTNNGVNYPLQIVHAKEDWIRIALPTLSSFPKYLFWDAAYPLANVSIWPIPNSTYSVTMQAMAPLIEFQYLTDAINLRPVYRNALMYNLAVRIAPRFGVEASPTTVKLATTTKRSMQKANTQIPYLLMPKDVLQNSHYNIYSDRSV